MKVLINRTDAIGDTLLSTPVAKLIKEHFPQAEVGFIVSPRSGDLINLCEGIDKVYIFNPKSDKAEQVKTLNHLFSDFQPDSYFHLGGSFAPTKMAWKKGIPIRGGLKSKLLSFLYLNKGIRQKRTSEGRHESLYNMEVMSPLKITPNLKKWNNYSPVLKIDSQFQKEVKAELQCDDQKAFIIIHPGMSGHTLNWSSENYGQLLVKLFESGPPLKLMVSFTPSDEPYLKGLRATVKKYPEMEKKIEFFDGSKKGLVHFAYVLSLADLFIGPSTGTTHMANALNIPQIGF
ncbi:MAG: glycosyltransferase family 9 protein, partial [Halobacteriovoraceae bacterium]|nr:glycosyltransferase family 9 protein [Halobacteriovoraceae bacterium]